MVPWGPMQRQLLNYVARHPQLKKTLENAASKARQSPSFKRAEERARSYYDKTVKDAAAGQGQGKGQQTGGNAGPKFSSFSEMKRRLILEWHKNKGRVFAFVTANFFFIIMAFQFLPVVWHGLVTGVKALTTPSPESKKKRQAQLEQQHQQHQTAAIETSEYDGEQPEKKKRRKRRNRSSEEDLGDEDAMEMHRNRHLSEEERKAIPQSPKRPVPFNNLNDKLGTNDISSKPLSLSAAAATGAATSSLFSFSNGLSDTPSSSMFDDTRSSTDKGSNVQDQFNRMHQGMFQNNSSEYDGTTIGFETSFLVKMGDETEFTSSLERESLTGKQSAH